MMCGGASCHFRRMARQRLGQHFLTDAGWREQTRAPSAFSSTHRAQLVAGINPTAGLKLAQATVK
jgi:hypothetical protein